MNTYMASKILIAFFLMTSVAYAEMNYITIEDSKDHVKLVATINKLVGRANKDKADDKEEKKSLKKQFKYIYDVENNMAKKMVNKGWISTHSEIEP